MTHRFFYCLDEGRYGELLALMSPEAVWHRQGRILRGHPQIRAALEARSSTQRIRHVITNAFLDKADDERAELRAYMTAYRFDDGKPSSGPVVIDGPFRLSLVRTRFARCGGEWRIVEQSLAPEFEFRAPGQASSHARAHADFFNPGPERHPGDIESLLIAAWQEEDA